MPGIENNLYRNSLHNLGEVSRCVIRRKESKLRSTCRSDLSHFSMEYDTWKSVDCNVGSVFFLNVGELCLLVVSLNPDVALDEINQLHSRSNQLSLLHMTLTYGPRCGRDN